MILEQERQPHQNTKTGHYVLVVCLTSYVQTELRFKWCTLLLSFFKFLNIPTVCNTKLLIYDCYGLHNLNKYKMVTMSK